MFQFLLATSGALALLKYLVIAVSLLFMRRKLVAIGKASRGAHVAIPLADAADHRVHHRHIRSDGDLSDPKGRAP
ncbi:gamma-aminobutyrate transporter [compost metagenome]